MNRILSLIFIAFTLSSCSQDLKDNFPTEIKTKKTNDHTRVEGTKIFAKIPEDYKFIDNLSRYQKEDNLYVQFIESNASNFYQSKPNFTREVIESKGAKVDILKDIKFNNLDAVFGDGPSKKLNERKTLFVFGDYDFVVIAVGVYPQNNDNGRNEILDIFKNLVYQKTFELNPFELANFEFDQSITNFKYANTMSNMFAFTEDGTPEKVGEFSTSMNIASMPKMYNEKSKEFILSIIQNAKNSGNEIKSSETQTTKIGDYPATVLETEMEVENKTGVMYVVLLNGKESSVLFMGTAFDRKSELLEKYKETVKTIKIK
ncbi:MAG: hypothetical protein CMC05_13610 [Flavobacteriaceae bacterium]|nr:hypothetical protein [Flavobacteriaceae bacterium]|tara:strand:+ start:1627 stop:2577 length:951 start_codon:yes stop_codon:yes gene_type:complete